MPVGGFLDSFPTLVFVVAHVVFLLVGVGDADRDAIAPPVRVRVLVVHRVADRLPGGVQRVPHAEDGRAARANADADFRGAPGSSADVSRIGAPTGRRGARGADGSPQRHSARGRRTARVILQEFAV